ncbi:hypothetical protein [Dactylosporangium sp. NPDC005555]|uniref:hypothetical protein n=1 Tax=Dactylosporangium sp. NPDC005555 TaxID=3154889 RepID=UPI0033B062ED
MDHSDAAVAVWRCSVQGFVTMRSAARHGVGEIESRAFGVAPELSGAGPLIAEVASACLAIRLALQAGCNNVEALAIAWAAVGEVGRRWLAETVSEYAGRRAYSGLIAVVEATRAPNAIVPDKPARQGCSRRANWCRRILMAGYSDIRELALDVTPDRNEAIARRRIEVIADACHRIPYPEEMPAVLRPWLVQRYLRDAWGSMTPEGRQWCREQSHGLDQARLRAINQIISS